MDDVGDGGSGCKMPMTLEFLERQASGAESDAVEHSEIARSATSRAEAKRAREEAEYLYELADEYRGLARDLKGIAEGQTLEETVKTLRTLSRRKTGIQRHRQLSDYEEMADILSFYLRGYTGEEENNAQ
jgi:hypothetical protein